MAKLTIYSNENDVDYKIELFQISNDKDAVLFIGKTFNSSKGLYLEITKNDLIHIRNYIITILNETNFE